jgi:phospholipid/cholesterol/gamma-HCH transport system substrate-binding protein
MEERFKFRHVHAITGTFVLVVVAVLIAAIVLTGRSQRWFRRNVTLRIVLSEAGAAGIRQGSEVYFLGTLVGTVSDVIVDKKGRMEARSNIRRDFFLFVRADSFAVVKKKFGVAGDSYFEITRGQGKPLPEKNASIVCNDQVPGAMEAAIEEIRSQAVLVAKKFCAGLDAWTMLGTNLVTSAQRLDQLFCRVDDMAADLQNGKGTVGKLLTDPTVADELEELLAKANASMDELKLILGNVQQASTNFPAIAGSVHQSAQDLPALVAQTQQTMHEIERLVRGMQRHWLIRKYVEQADVAATNKASRVKKP